jgi:hypothetical protein
MLFTKIQLDDFSPTLAGLLEHLSQANPFTSHNGGENAPPAASPTLALAPPTSLRQMNAFSPMERLMFRPSSHKYDLPNPLPTFPTAIYLEQPLSLCTGLPMP